MKVTKQTDTSNNSDNDDTEFDILEEIALARQREEETQQEVAIPQVQQHDAKDAKLKDANKPKIQFLGTGRHRSKKKVNDGIVPPVVEGTTKPLKPKEGDDDGSSFILQVVQERAQQQGNEETEGNTDAGAVDDQTTSVQAASVQSDVIPGAFRGAPGEDLMQTEHLRFSLVGAAGIDPSGLSGFSTSQSLSVATMGGDGTDLHSFGSLRTSGVVEANPVSERELMEAQPVPDHEEKPERRKNMKRQKLVFLVMVIGCVIITTVCGVTLGLQRRVTSAKAESSPSIFPSESPTMTPSLAPTSALEGFAEMDLPNYTLESLRDPFSPQALAYTWLSDHPNANILSTQEKQQLFAMVTFFYAMDGENWPTVIKNSWLEYDRESCDWYSSAGGYYSTNSMGVLEYVDFHDRISANESSPCDQDGNFTNLSLEAVDFSRLNNPFIPPEIGLLTNLYEITMFATGRIQKGFQAELSHFLPVSTLQALTNLRVFRLTRNDLFGTIPSELAFMTKLTSLELSENNLIGPLPSELSELTDLELLGLSLSLLSSHLPSGLLQINKLTELRLEQAQLSGSLPSDIVQLTNLRILALSNNSMTGTIPTELALFTALEVTLLYNNLLTGMIPTELALVTGQTRISLDGNSLSGTLPTELATLSTLGWLGFSRNAISGSLPTELGLLTTLAFLEADHNFLTGPIPTELGLLGHSLTGSFDLSYNHLTGAIPSEFGLFQYLFEFSLLSNALSGRIPTELSLPVFLALDLRDNLLSGPIPVEFGLQPPYMHALRLDSNLLTGTIPVEIGMMWSLVELGLSGLSLTGPVPAQVAALAANNQLRILRISNNTNLTGTLPVEFCSLQSTNCTCFFEMLCNGCSLEFDCTEQFCGCGCSCGS